MRRLLNPQILMSPTPPSPALISCVQKAAAELGYDLGTFLNDENQTLIARIGALLYRERRRAAEQALSLARARAWNKPRNLSPSFCAGVLRKLFPEQP